MSSPFKDLINLYKRNNWHSTKISKTVYTLSLCKGSDPMFTLINGGHKGVISKKSVTDKVNSVKENGQLHTDEIFFFNESGYQGCAGLDKSKISLFDKSKLVELEHSASYGYKTPSIELKAHNLNAVNNTLKYLHNNEPACVVHATGTGKSYIIQKLLSIFHGRKTLILSPSNYINTVLKKLTPDHINAEFLTFSKVDANMGNIEFNYSNYDFIILDEYHRAGADSWGAGIQKLLECSPNALLFGTTATDQRYLDNNRNMSLELFNGHIASQITLTEAIARKILPKPKYIKSIFNYNNIIELMKEKVKKKKCLDKTEFHENLDMLKLNWETSHNVENVIKEHMTSYSGKYVVFCDSYDQMAVIKKLLNEKLKIASGNKKLKINSFEMKCENNKHVNDRAISNFRYKSDDELSLLFSVNMLNEGIHIPNVRGAFLFRATRSPIVYFQQIGRAFDARSSFSPIIFDFVNNIDNIETSLFDNKTLMQLEKEIAEKREEDGLFPEDYEINDFYVYDYAIDFLEALNLTVNHYVPSADIQLEDRINMIKEYMKVNGHDKMPYTHTHSGYPIGIWLKNNRQTISSGKDYSEENKQALIANGISTEYAYSSDQLMNTIERYYGKNGHITPEPNEMFEGRNVKDELAKIRYKFNINELSKQRISRLKAMNFVFESASSPNEELFSYWMKHMLEFGTDLVDKDFKYNDYKLGEKVANFIKIFKTIDKSESRENPPHNVNFVRKHNIQLDGHRAKKQRAFAEWWLENRDVYAFIPFPDIQYKGINIAERAKSTFASIKKGTLDNEILKILIDSDFPLTQKEHNDNGKINVIVNLHDATGTFPTTRSQKHDEEPVGKFFFDFDKAINNETINPRTYDKLKKKNIFK